MKLYFSILFLMTGSACFSQSDSVGTNSLKKNKSTFYFGWGYNRDWYSKGNIHLVNNNPQLIDGKYYTYDYTVYNAIGHDRPQFDKIKDVVNITVPQFNVRMGWFFNDKKDFGIELNYDHAKYVVDDYQKARVKGQINGQGFDKDTVLNPNSFLHYEHTDGANFVMMNLIKRWILIASPKYHSNIGLIVKPGFGFVYPRTDVTVFGNRVNNNWKVSGLVAGIETGIRMEFLKNGYVEFTGKGGCADYMNALVQGKGYGKASNTFWYAEAILILGYQFNCKI